MSAATDDSIQAWRLPTEVLPTGQRQHNEDIWEQVKRLGNGTFGDVWQERCVSGPSRDAVRAIKQISKRHGVISQRELQALVTFSDRRIPEFQDHFVQCLGWFDDPTHFFIAMELVQCGDLQSYVSKQRFSDPEAATIISQVAQALRHMHTSGFVHRDLKPLNLLVSQPGPNWRVKLADFGISKNVDGTALKTLRVGTQGYMAPEVLDDTEESYTASVDVWSLGAVAFCLRTGHPPFRTVRQLIDYTNNRTQFPIGPIAYESGVYTNFVMGAMDESPRRRFTIDQIIAHQWLVMNSEASQKTAYSAYPRSTQGTRPWDKPESNAWSNTYDADGTYEGSASTSDRSLDGTVRPNSQAPIPTPQDSFSTRETGRPHLPRHSQSWATPASNAWSNTQQSDAAGSSQGYSQPVPQDTVFPDEPPIRPAPQHSQSWSTQPSHPWANRYSVSAPRPAADVPAMGATLRSVDDFTSTSGLTYAPPSNSSHTSPPAPATPEVHPWANRYAQATNPREMGMGYQASHSTASSGSAGSGYSGSRSSSNNTPFSSYGSAYQAPHPSALVPGGGSFTAYKRSTPAQPAEAVPAPLAAGPRRLSSIPPGQGMNYGNAAPEFLADAQPYGSAPSFPSQPAKPAYQGASQNRYQSQNPGDRGSFRNAPSPVVETSQYPYQEGQNQPHGGHVPIVETTQYDTQQTQSHNPGHNGPLQQNPSVIVDMPQYPYQQGQSQSRAGITPNVETPRHNDQQSPNQHPGGHTPSIDAASQGVPAAAGPLDPRTFVSNAFGEDAINNPKLMASVEEAIRRIITPEIEALRKEQRERESQPQPPAAAPAAAPEASGSSSSDQDHSGLSSTFSNFDPSAGHTTQAKPVAARAGSPGAYQVGWNKTFKNDGSRMEGTNQNSRATYRSSRAPSPGPQYVNADPESTCLYCGEQFYHRDELFEHIEANNHGVDPITKRPEHYVRPESSRNFHRNAQTYSNVGKSGSEPSVSHYNTCLTCKGRFDSRSDLFEHIEAAGHGVSLLTGEPESYNRPASSRRRDDMEPSTRRDDSYLTCLACHSRFDSRDDLFEHIEAQGHGIDPATGRKEYYRRPDSYRSGPSYQTSQPGQRANNSYNSYGGYQPPPQQPSNGYIGYNAHEPKKRNMFSRMKDKFSM